MINWMEAGVVQSKFYPGICLEGLRKIRKKPNPGQLMTGLRFQPSTSFMSTCLVSRAEGWVSSQQGRSNNSGL
jgi:hypothetical protein